MALTYKVIRFPLLKFRIIDVCSWWLKHNCGMAILWWIITTQNTKSPSCIAVVVAIFIHHIYILIEKVFRKRSVSYDGILHQVWTDDRQFVKCHDLSCCVTKVFKPKIEMQCRYKYHEFNDKCSFHNVRQRLGNLPLYMHNSHFFPPWVVNITISFQIIKLKLFRPTTQSLCGAHFTTAKSNTTKNTQHWNKSGTL